MNNAITDIKSTLEGTNSRITEAEDRISEVEDKMVEINETERKKEKWIKRNEENLRDLWDNVKRPNIRIIGGPKRRRQKERPWENTRGDSSWKLAQNGEGNSHTSPRNPGGPKQDKPNVKHPKTHINQVNKDQTQRTNIKSSKGETTNNTQRDSHKDNQLIYQ